MKTLFTKPVSRMPYIWLADETNMIICYDNYQFCDLAGNPIPEEYRLKLIQEHYSDDDDEEFQFAEPENQGIQEPLFADTITDPDCDDIDEVFGQYGFKNRDGEYVIEPQYAYAHNFTNGLAAVNLNRTWYTDEDGRRSYECHYGYIDEHGKTIIPFAYDYAEPFNKYGVAVVSNFNGGFLIDKSGNRIPVPEEFAFTIYHGYEDRYYEIYYREDDPDDTPEHRFRNGIYDTKERKVLIWPTNSIVYFNEQNEDLIQISERSGDYGFSDDRQYNMYFINSRGERLYPWLTGKGFSHIDPPNGKLLSVVGVTRYVEADGSPARSPLEPNKKYDRKNVFGIYSSKEQFVLPLQYDKIFPFTDTLFACIENGIASFIELEDSDL